MALPQLNQVIRTYLYGSDAVPPNFVDTNLLRDRSATVTITGVSSQEFMSGPGRFALSSSFEAVYQFFDDLDGYDVSRLFTDSISTEVRLSKAAWAQGVLGLNSSSLVIDHKDFDDGLDSYAERVYLWGNTAFQLSDDSEFVISRVINADGTYSYTRTIENFAVLPRLDTGENFDFVSADGTTTQTQSSSQHAVDASGIGRTVLIDFVDDVVRETFSEADYWASVQSFGDLGYGRFETNLPRQWQLQSGTQEIFDSLFSVGITATFWQDKFIIYGTNSDDVLEGWVTAAGHNLLQQYTNVGPYSFLMPQFESALNGMTYFSGDGNDVVRGTTLNDIILDGLGIDVYDGDGGFDLVDYSYSSEFVEVDLEAGTANGDTLIQIEAVIGSAYNDTFVANGSQDRSLAGGTGDDTFNINAVGSAPVIIWGGEGADEISITTIGGATGAGSYAAGILIVNVVGLTEDNFHLFDIENLGIGGEFAWENIDTVVINPDSSDRILVDGALIGAADASVRVVDFDYDLVAEEFVQRDMGYFTVNNAVLGSAGSIFASYSTEGRGPLIVRDIDLPDDFLNYTGMVLTPVQQFHRFVEERRFPLGGELVTRIDPSYQEGGEIDVPQEEIDTIFGPYNIGRADDYNLSGASIVGEWTPHEIAEYNEAHRLHFFYWEESSFFDSASDVRLGWFVVGGSLTGSVLQSDGTFSYTMPEIDETSGSSGGSGGSTGGSSGGGTGGGSSGGGSSGTGSSGGGSSGGGSGGSTGGGGSGGSSGGGSSGGTGGYVPRGGQYAVADQVVDLDAGSGGYRYRSFDAVKNSVVINGVAQSAATLSAGVSVSEVNGSTVLRFGNDDFVVLRGVTLAAWQAGSAAQIKGGMGDDVLTGTASADVFVGGNGGDTITGGLGDDWINYTSGNDVIIGDMENRGQDTLDLRQFTASQLHFSISGNDILIETPNGTIRLENQLRHDLGHSRSNIETILIAGATLTESAIRVRALADQATEGNDTIQGTVYSDFLYGLGGNDTLIGASGNDTFSFQSGNDVIMGFTENRGQDTLDLTGYSLADARFTVSGFDILITLPDGTVRLESQIRYDLGHDRSNIETIQFYDGILTEAATRARAILDQATSGNDTIQGTAYADNAVGLDGNDSLIGSTGNDTLYGGDGADTLNAGGDTDSLLGGAGNDTYVIDAVTDVVAEANEEGIDLVQSAVNWTLGANVENLTLTSAAAVTGTGNELANTITGTAGNNSLSGLDGNDTLIGDGGNDTLLGGAGHDLLDGGTGTDSLTGGAGNDTYVVNLATDVVVEAANEGIDVVQSGAAWTLGANFENLILIGDASVAATGNAANNYITGNAGKNTLSGLDGNDTLLGAAGIDTLTGGNGADQFVFNNTQGGIDVITDFNELNGGGEEGDVLRFEGMGVGTFAYRGTGAFTGGSDNSEARISGNRVLVDTNGDGVADITITLTGLTTASQLNADDFIFV